jgi:hypothetical protein
MSEDELNDEEKRIMEEDVLKFVGHQKEEDQEEWIGKMKILNEDLINQWKREKNQGQGYTEFRNKKIKEKSLKKERRREDKEKEEENKEKWKMRLRSIYLRILKWFNEYK